MADTLPIPADTAAHPVLTVVDGQPTTTSMDVARFFGRQHKHVMDAVRTLVDQLPADHQPNFRPMIRDIPIGKGATRREHYFVLTFDGFILLAMGFTGAKALQVKLAYMAEFKRLQAAEQGAQVKRLAAELNQAGQLALHLEEDLHGTQRALIKAQADQIRLLRKVNRLQSVLSAREKTTLAVTMERRGEHRDRIRQATGLNFNHLRQVFFRARACGDLPPVNDADALQALLDLDGDRQEARHV